MASEYPDGEEEDVPPAIAELSQASAPTSLRGIRACKRCGILKTLDQFLNEGCENCPFLDIADNPERANSCTSAFTKDRLPLWTHENRGRPMDPCGQLPSGVYAIAVTGQFDRDIEEDLENRGIRWRCKPVGSTAE
ncbi:Spt4/RpoE2 zinc finger [Fragilaria crotonensis]|nr:Spt4/RpoE2 zinc finger [Fragilaria crotonensis]